MKTVPISLSDAIMHVSWQDFFAAWNIAPALAQIADIRGCGHCQAQWLAAQPTSQLAEATQAMQLLKEARVALDRLQRDLRADSLHVESAEIPQGMLLHATLTDEIEQIAKHYDPILPEKAKLYRTLSECLPMAAIEATYLQLAPAAETVETVEANGENCTYMPSATKPRQYTADRNILERAEKLFPAQPLSQLAIVSNSQLFYIKNRK